MPAQESVAPISFPAKCSLISLPRMYFGRYCHFLMSALASTPFLHNSMMAFKTQNPESRITMKAKLKIGASIRSNKPIVGPISSPSFLPNSFSQSLPSMRSMPHMIPLKQQQTKWYSLPNGQGLQGTNMKPGHVYWLVHTLMDTSRQFAYPGENC